MSLVVSSLAGPHRRRPGRGGRDRRPVLALRRHRVDRHLHPRLPDPGLRPDHDARTVTEVVHDAVTALSRSATPGDRRAPTSPRAQPQYRSARHSDAALRQGRRRPRRAHRHRGVRQLRRLSGDAFLPAAAHPDGDQVRPGRLFFMHLRFDAKIFGRLFWAGFFLAIARLRRRAGHVPVLRQGLTAGGAACSAIVASTRHLAFQPHPEVWLLVAFLVGAYIYASGDRPAGGAGRASPWSPAAGRLLRRRHGLLCGWPRTGRCTTSPRRPLLASTCCST